MTTGRINQIATPIGRVRREGKLRVANQGIRQPGVSRQPGALRELGRRHEPVSLEKNYSGARTIVRGTEPRSRSGHGRTVKSVHSVQNDRQDSSGPCYSRTACRKRERLSAGQPLFRLFQLLSLT